MKKLLLTNLLAIVLLSTGFAQAIDKEKLDRFFDRLLEKNKAMGSLIIAKNGEVQYSRSIGFSAINGTEKTPLNADSRYRIGSVTKMFTAVMIFQLAEEGKINLTDNLNKFFPDIPNADKITIEQLLGHRSGVHDMIEGRDLARWRTSGIAKEEILALMYKSTPDFEPGAKYAYSNSGYFLLGNIIEKITGKSYEAAVSERIILKIGLPDTYEIMVNADISKNESLSYRYAGEWKALPTTHHSLLLGAGSMVSTPGSMAKFIQALFDLKLISRAHLDKMIQDKAGMDTFVFNGKTFYGHTGGIDGFGAWIAYYPEEKLTFSYATNGKVYPVKDILEGVADIYWGKRFKIPAFDTYTVSEEILQTYVGVYSSAEAPVKFTVSREGTTLFIQPPNQAARPVEATSDNEFKLDPPGIIFEFDAAKKQMTIKRPNGERVFTKEN
jgi:CubicO group peptidase (beta-lactamase class C family)